MAIEELNSRVAIPYNEKIRKDLEEKEKEIPGCHIMKKGKRILVTIPKSKDNDEKTLIFSADEVRKLIQDIYVGD